jgi:hypothetical protein
LKGTELLVDDGVFVDDIRSIPGQARVQGVGEVIDEIDKGVSVYPAERPTCLGLSDEWH